MVQNPEISKLKEVNLHLKTKLNQLTLALDVALNKTQSKEMPNHDALQELNNLVKFKDAEISNSHHTINQLRKELQTFTNKGYIPSGIDRIQELEAALDIEKRRTQELIKEIKSLNKI